MKLHLGTTGQHTVYEAELVGMILGLHLIKTKWRNTTKCVLNVDNQAELISIKMKINKSGQHLVAIIHQMAAKLHESRGKNKFRLMVETNCAGGERLIDDVGKGFGDLDSISAL